MQIIKTPFITILLIFLCFFVYTKLAGTIPFFVNSVSTAKTDIFTVNGVGEASAVPNTANISLGISNTGTNIVSVQSQTNTIINKITQDLKNLGIEEKNIKTTNYSIYPNYNYAEGKQTVNGYTVAANITTKITPIEKLNQAIDLATKNGANTIGGISFTVNDNDLEKLKSKARKQAIAKAKEKAKSIANEAGISLGKIINVSESGDFSRPIPMYATQDMKTTEATQIQPGENSITINITLSYETL